MEVEEGGEGMVARSPSSVSSSSSVSTSISISSGVVLRGGAGEVPISIEEGRAVMRITCIGGRLIPLGRCRVGTGVHPPHPSDAHIHNITIITATILLLPHQRQAVLLHRARQAR